MKELVSECNSTQIGTELIYTLRGWHNLEQAKDPNMRIIDFDFAPLVVEEIPQFRDRVEVRDRLQRILESVDPDTSPVDEFIHAKVLSMLTYAEALEGAEYDFYEYVERTIGVTPTLVSEEEIQAQYQLTADLFRVANPGLIFTPEGWQAFLKIGAVSYEDIRDTIIDAKNRIEPIVMSTIGRRFQTNSEPIFVDKDLPWMCRIYGDAKGLYFEVNHHEKILPRWHKGKPEQFASHERGAHLIQAISIRENVQEGIIPPVLGQMTLPGPEQMVNEGIADTLHFLIPEIYPLLFEYGKFAVELGYLQDLVNNNVHIWVNTENQGYDERYARQFAMHFLPNETEKLFNDRLEHRRLSKYRAYWPAYYEGARYFHRIAKTLPQDQIVSVLRFAYSRPLTPVQIKRFVHDLPAQTALSA